MERSAGGEAGTLADVAWRLNGMGKKGTPVPYGGVLQWPLEGQGRGAPVSL